MYPSVKIGSLMGVKIGKTAALLNRRQHQRYVLVADDGTLGRLRAYVVCNPHLDDSGDGASARVTASSGRTFILAEKGRRFLAIGADIGFTRASCGFAAVSDGLTDLLDNKRMDWVFERAESGNVVVTGELPAGARAFTVCIRAIATGT